MKISVHLLISGRVQGVFFRSSTKEKALELGLTGWVRNLPDGKVEVMVEGEKEKVKKLEEWCQEGPQFAEVSQVEREESVFTGELRKFEIRY